jgi:hypothetical protein
MSEFNEFMDDVEDFELYASQHLKIRTKRGEVRPLELNLPQKIVHKIVMDLRAAGKPVKLIILKARQQGISTYSEALIFHDTSLREGRKSRIIAHEPDSSNSIFDMTKLFYDELPPVLAPMRRYNNTKRLVFENPDPIARKTKPGLRSSIQVATASKKEVRGSTVQNLHCSEVAFWPDAEKLMLGALQEVPDHPDTTIILESTANGVGGYFHSTYWAAKRGENEYTAIFLPWHIFAEYARPVPDGFVLTNAEEELKKLYNLTDEQIAWRRWAIANKCGGSELKFRQEYPASDAEAFIVSGSPKFNVENLAVYQKHAPKPRWIGDLTSPDTAKGVRTPEMNKYERGTLKIYKWPDPKKNYVIGSDTAKGTVNSDWSVGQVLEEGTGDLCATLRGKIKPTELAYALARLGYFYGGASKAALLAVEINKDGITTVTELHKTIKYPNLFRRRTTDQTSEQTEYKLGFHTNDRTRPIILNKLDSWINEGEFSFNDETSIIECMTFVKDENGKYQAQEGCHDDCVIALAVAVYVFDYAPAAPKEKTDHEKLKEKLQSKNQEGW